MILIITDIESLNIGDRYDIIHGVTIEITIAIIAFTTILISELCKGMYLYTKYIIPEVTIILASSPNT